MPLNFRLTKFEIISILKYDRLENVPDFDQTLSCPRGFSLMLYYFVYRWREKPCYKDENHIVIWRSSSRWRNSLWILRSCSRNVGRSISDASRWTRFTRQAWSLDTSTPFSLWYLCLGTILLVFAEMGFL